MAAFHRLILWIFIHATMIAAVLAVDPGPSNSEQCRQVRVKLTKPAFIIDRRQTCKTLCEREIRDYGRHKELMAMQEVYPEMADTSVAGLFQPWSIDKCVVRPSAICYRGSSFENDFLEERKHLIDRFSKDSRFSDQLLHGCTSSSCYTSGALSFFRRKGPKVGIFNTNSIDSSPNACICTMTIQYQSVYIADQVSMPYQSSAVSCAYHEFVRRHLVKDWLPLVATETHRAQDIGDNEWTVSSAFACSSERVTHCPCSAGDTVWCTAAQVQQRVTLYPL